MRGLHFAHPWWAVALSLLALLSPALAARSLAQHNTTILKGRAIVIAQDQNGAAPDVVLGLQTADGRRVRLQLQHPGQAAGLHTGMHIAVTGRWACQEAAHGVGGVASAAAAPSGGSGPFVAASMRATGTGGVAPKPASRLDAVDGGAVAAAAAAASSPIARSSNKLISDTVNAIFIPIQSVRPSGAACPSTAFPSITLAQVRKALFRESNPAGTTVGSTFAKCSYNQTLLTAGNSMLADTVELPCGGASRGVPWSLGGTCGFDDYNGAADAADAVLRARGVDLSKYKHRVYLLPPSACAFVGLGYQGCDGTFDCRVWIGSDYWATPQAIIHELLHNLYLAHAGAVTPYSDFDEYADLSGTMGYCCSDRCPNTPHAWQLGWIAPRLLDGTSLKPGQTVAATVAAQSSSRFSGLRIVPSWASGVDPLYVGYRIAAGGDAGIEANAVPGDDDAPLPPAPGRLHLYSAPIQGPTDSRFTTWQATLAAPGQAWAYPHTGLVVRLVAALRGSAQLTLCRRGGAETLASCQAGQDLDCNGLAGDRDPACVRLLRRPRG